MSLAKFGVIYSTGNAIIMGFIYPSQSDAELNSFQLQPGQALVQVSRGPYPSSAAWQAAVNNAVQTAAGKAPGNPRCAVVDNSTMLVTGWILADPALYSIVGSQLVTTLANVPIGSTYDPVGKTFTTPAKPGGTNRRGESYDPSVSVVVPQ